MVQLKQNLALFLRALFISTTIYSHLSNKRGVHAYQFWKIPPLHIFFLKLHKNCLS